MRALLPLLLLLMACPKQGTDGFRFLDTPQDFERLGLSEEVQPAEDGRHTLGEGDEYEWWYLDALLDDGTVVVVWFGDNWLPGHRQHVYSIEVTTPDGHKHEHAQLLERTGSFSTEGADVRFGSHRFQGDGTTWHIRVDPAEAEGLGCDLHLTRTAPSHRPGTGYFGDEDEFFAWLSAAPEGTLEGTLTVDGLTREVQGSGYHDHNWGDTAPWELMEGWWWGRATVDGYTVVMADLRGTKKRGSTALPLLYVAADGQVVVDAHGDQVRFTEEEATAHPDPGHRDPMARAVVIEAGDVSVRFERTDEVLISYDILGEESGLVRLLARMAGRSPWYSRFVAATLLRVGGEEHQGEGTIEYMDFD